MKIREGEKGFFDTTVDVYFRVIFDDLNDILKNRPSKITLKYNNKEIPFSGFEDSNVRMYYDKCDKSTLPNSTITFYGIDGYVHSIISVGYYHELRLTLKEDKFKEAITKLIKDNEVLKDYATKKELTEYGDEVKDTYATKKELEGILSGGGISKTSNNNMRIRKIENEIKRLQKELDAIKSKNNNTI